MVKLSKNIGLHLWKQIDWKACNLELLGLQAKTVWCAEIESVIQK